MTTSSSLAVATRAYPTRPSRAWIRACMLEAYIALRPRLERPVLDLGCGDGQFSQALRACGVIEAIDVGLDFLLADLLAMRTRPTIGRVRGDLVRLPFADRSFAAVLCNTVLSSFHGGDGGLDTALAEVRRVLRPGGALLASVATPRFSENLTLRHALNGVGARAAAQAYVQRVNRHHDHTVLLDAAGWEQRLAAAGLTVERRTFFGRPAHARFYARLCLLNPLAFAKYARSDALAAGLGRTAGQYLAAPLARTLAREPVDDPGGAGDAGFVVLLARRRN